MVDRNPAHQRSSWPLLVGLGLVGLVTGALAGYFGYSFAVVAKNPLVSVADDSGEQPFDQTYREMARLAGLEIVAGKCDSAPDPRIIDQEKQLIDQIEVSAKKANLDPPLSIARAVVAYRGSACCFSFGATLCGWQPSRSRTIFAKRSDDVSLHPAL